MPDSCADRVVIVTGAGRGLGRSHALALAREGARVVVNDLGAALDGRPDAPGAADQVVDEIRELGGTAVASRHDVADYEQAGDLVQQALDELGGLDAVVNNAGILRDKMFVSSSMDAWDAVMRVHLRGHFAVSRHAAAWWRAEHKAGRPRHGRIVNTTSGAGLQGSVGQSAYATAKGGIASLTLVQAAELRRYGITANAIAPAARTRMTEVVFAQMMRAPEEGFDAWSPDNVSPLVVFLCSAASSEVSGRVFEVAGGAISISNGWSPGPRRDLGRRWEVAEVADGVRTLLAAAPTPPPVYGA